MAIHASVRARVAFILGACACFLFSSSAAHAAGDLVTVIDGIQNITTENFASNSGDVADGCITPGTHRVMRFNFRSRNVGDADIVGGAAPAYLCSPTACGLNACNRAGTRSGNFVWSDSHCHWHLFEFNKYSFMNSSQSVVGTGFKQAFCLMDFTRVDPTAPATAKYDCSNQGVQPGWEDVYGAGLPCQFINMDNIGNGKYRLVSTTDQSRVIAEARYNNNTTVNVIQVSGDTVTPVGGDWLEELGAAADVTKAPAVAVWGPGREHIFWVGASANLVHDWRDPSSSGRESLGKPSGINLVGDVSVAAWEPGRLDVFVRGSDNKIWHQWWNGSSWGTWESPANMISAASSPSVVSMAPGRLNIFYVNTSGTITHAYWSGGWGSEILSGPPGDTLVGDPVAVSTENGRINAFFQTGGHNIFNLWWNGSWGSEIAFTGDIGSTPSVVSWGIKRLDFAWLTLGGDVGHGWWTPAGYGRENKGRPAGSVLITLPKMVSWGPNHVDIFVGDDNGRLFHNGWTGAWSGWGTMSSTFNLVHTTPTPVSWGNGQIDVFYGSTSGGLNRNTWW